MSLAQLLQQGIEVRELSSLPYEEALDLQTELSARRERDEIPDTVLLLQHPHVYTVGIDNVDLRNLLRGDLPAPLVPVGRGGKITYHGPGQIIAYFIFKVPIAGFSPFYSGIEDLTISVLQHFGIDAYSRKNEKDAYGKNIRGAWCQYEGVHKKIAAQGLETKGIGGGNLVTMHGFALNVSTDLDYFKHINACGFNGNIMSSIQDMTGKEVSLEEVKSKIKEELERWEA